MKIYIQTDLEGVAGVVMWEDRKDNGLWNIHMRQQKARLLTAEVNAAIAGAFDAGASEVVVDDSHGRGYTILVEELDERAEIIHGRVRPRIMPGIDASFDGMIIVGAHAKAGTRGGVLYHSMSWSVREIRINGEPIGEIGIFAFVAGAFGVPTLMLTGDQAACREASALVPNLVTVPVKEGLSRYAARSVSPARSRKMIREAAARAVGLRGSIKPYILRPPFTYQADSYPADASFGEDALDGARASHPASLPDSWTTGEMITAPTARELIDKVWESEV